MLSNVDSWVDRVSQAGAKIVKPIEDYFYGDRAGMVEDPYWTLWYIAAHQEDVIPEEIKRRFEELVAHKHSHK